MKFAPTIRLIKQTKLLAFVTAIILAGCAVPIEWIKNGATGPDLRQDLYACAKKTLVPEYMSVAIDYKVRELCMVYRGWKKVGSAGNYEFAPAAP
jgi:hypothetical protein